MDDPLVDTSGIKRDPVPYIVVSFKSNHAQLPGTLENMISDIQGDGNLVFSDPTMQREWVWRQQVGNRLDALLKSKGLGWCDGGGMGVGTINIELMLHNWEHAHEAAQVIIDDLTDCELIAFATVGLWEHRAMTVCYPPNGKWNKETCRIEI